MCNLEDFRSICAINEVFRPICAIYRNFIKLDRIMVMLSEQLVYVTVLFTLIFL